MVEETRQQKRWWVLWGYQLSRGISKASQGSRQGWRVLRMLWSYQLSRPFSKASLGLRQEVKLM